MLKEILENLRSFDHDKLLEKDTDSDYQKFFTDKLANWKVKSPAELSKEERKKFFAEVQKEWA